MENERENQIDATYVGKSPSDFVSWLEGRAGKIVQRDLRETATLIEAVEGDYNYSPLEKYELFKEANHLIKVMANRCEDPKKLYEETKYRFFATNKGPVILNCRQEPESGWLEIV